MKFLSVRDLRGKSSAAWRDLAEERELVLTNKGRPFAILSAVNEGNLETSLAAIRRAKAVDALASVQVRSVKSGTYRLSPADIDAEIRAVRSRRSK